MLKVSLNGFGTHEQLVRNLLGFDPALGKAADPEFGARQRVRIEMLAMVPSVCQLQLLARFRRQTLGAARLRQFDRPPQ